MSLKEEQESILSTTVNDKDHEICSANDDYNQQQQLLQINLQQALENGTSLNATELIWIVDENNNEIRSGLRKDMRLHNLWHRATYILIIQAPPPQPTTTTTTTTMKTANDTTTSISKMSTTNYNNSNLPCVDLKWLHNTKVYVQRRSYKKDYCPGKYDPLPGGVIGYNESYIDNAIRELKEEMNISVVRHNSSSTGSSNTTGTSTCSTEEEGNAILNRLFSFPYQDNNVRVYGEFFECYYYGTENDIILQKDEVDSVLCITLRELLDLITNESNNFMPDACYGIQLYLQRLHDIQYNRKLLKGYSSSNLDSYILHPKPQVIFFDCDDCLYFDNWTTANILTKRIDDWCITQHNLQSGKAYELYKQYGTALRGLLAEGYIDNTTESIDKFLNYCHDIPISELIQPDNELRTIILQMDPSIRRYIFTASVEHHAHRCLQALGIDDLFIDIIDCKKCNMETKHSEYSFYTAMRIAGIGPKKITKTTKSNSDEDTTIFDNDDDDDDNDNINYAEQCVFFDDNITNISAARKIGWRSILVGTVSRDNGQPISSDHAELEVDTIHHIRTVMPELFLS